MALRIISNRIAELERMLVAEKNNRKIMGLKKLIEINLILQKGLMAWEK